MSALKKTAQQEAITQYVGKSNDSLNVVARAGSGKTTSLLMICEVLEGSAFLGAFNKAIATELKARLKAIDNQMIEAGTFHSLGFQGWRRENPGVKVDGDKLWKYINEMPTVKEHIGSSTRELVSLAKQCLFKGDEAPAEWESLIDYHAIDVNFRKEMLIDAAKTIFKRSADDCKKIIDFDDMLFAPLHFNSSLPKYDSMMIDEAQDTNEARRELALRCLEDGGRIIAVGDDRQAIYGFSGADADSMDLIKKAMKSRALPLTVSWRCGVQIIERAQLWVPDIEWAPKAGTGEVREITDIAVWKGLAAHSNDARIPQPGDAVLCRNTRPLVSLAYHCIRNRVGVAIEGRDIGKRLIKLVEKFKEVNIPALQNRIEAYCIEECERLIQKNKPGIAASLEDLCNTLTFLCDSLKCEGKTDTRDLTALLDRMFSDSNGNGASNILLSTIHKSKGREWNHVFILGEAKYQPSKYAKKAWMRLQEENLMYVATTRAKNVLTHIVVTVEE